MTRPRFGRRAGWGIADQTASSLTNFALGIFVARQTSPTVFGAFALAFVTYVLFLNVGRAVVAFPLLIRYSGDATPRWADGAGRATGAALAVGVAAGIGCIAVGLIASGNLGAALLGLGICMPGLLLQDAWRFVFVAGGRDREAFLNDAVWVGVLVLTFGALVASGSDSVFEIVLTWGFAASVAAGVGIIQAGLSPAVRGIRSWFLEHADLIPRFTAETVARVGMEPVSSYLVGLISGLVAVGALRAAGLVLGPFNIFFQGVHMAAVPEASRLLQESSSALMRWCLVLSAGMAGAAAVFGGIGLALPDPLGRFLLGASWEPARLVLFPLIVGLVGFVGAAGAVVGLRALAAASRVLRAAAISSVVGVIAAALGASVGGATGAAWGLALGSWSGSAASWMEFRAALRDEGLDPPGEVR